MAKEEEKKGNPFAKGKKPEEKNTEAKEDNKSSKPLPPFAKKGEKEEKPVEGADKGAADSKEEAPEAGKKPNPFAKGDEKTAAKPADGKKPPFAAKDGEKKKPEVDKSKILPIEKGEQDKVVFNPQIPNIEEDIDYICEFEDYDLFTEEMLQEYVEDLQSLDEVLSYEGRMKRRAVMRKYRSKLRMKRARAVQKRASNEVIGHRARRMAVNTLKTRFSQGRNSSDLAVSEKQRIERMVAARKKLVDRLSTKMVRTAKTIERDRLAGHRSK